MGLLGQEVRLSGCISKEPMLLKPGFYSLFRDSFRDFIKIPPFHMEFSLKNRNAITMGEIKVPLVDPGNKEFCTVKAKDGKLFLKGGRLIVFFKKVKPTTDIRGKDIGDRAIVIPPSGEPCREL